MRTVRARSVDAAHEREVLEAALRGDEAGFSELYSLYSRRVYVYTLRRVGEPSLAEDITQEVFFQVHRSLKSFRGQSTLLCWIFGIARNLVSGHYRASASRIQSARTAPEQADIPIEAGTERRIDAVRALRRCAEVLSNAERSTPKTIFLLCYGESNSVHQIAKQVGKSHAAVKASLHRSRSALLDRVPELSQFVDTPSRVAV
jgi:RNA polymerase sigma-70 factor (ECF subfamily)